MNILYVHGLGGGIDSLGGQFIKKYCKQDNVYNPDIPVKPKDAVNFILDFCNEHKIDLVVGHSLGGFYSMCIGSVAKILINPAMYPSKDLFNVTTLGLQEFHSRREDGSKYFNIDEEYMKQLKKEEDFFYSDVDYEIRVENFAVFGKQDEYFSHIEDFKKVFKKEPVVFDGTHRINEEQFKTYVLPLIEYVRVEYYNGTK